MNREPQAARLPDGPSPVVVGGEVVAALALVVALYWDVFAWWREAWTTESYFCTHGPLIPLVSAYLVWTRVAEKRAELSVSLGRETPWLGGALLVVLAVAMQFVALRLDVRVISGFSFVLLCIGAVVLVLGREWGRALLFPLGFLVFMIPVPFVANALTTPLQMRSAAVATMVGGALGMSVERHGLILQLPNYSFEVAPACSGVNSLFSIVPLAILFASQQELNTWRKAVLMVLGAPIALAANTIRIVLTLGLARFFGEEAADGFFHGLSGLVLFAVALAILFGVGRGLTVWGKHAEAPA